MKQLKAYWIHIALISVSVLWGTSFAAAKIGLRELAPLNLVISRFFIASLLFGAILVITKSKPIARQDIPAFTLLGFLGITSYFYIQYTGLKFSTSINAALIIATSPIWAALFCAVLGSEKPTLLSIFGIITAFTGVALIVTNGNLSGLFRSETLIGDLMLLANALVWAGFTVYGKTLLQKYRPFTAMAYINIFGTAMLLPLAFFPDPLTPVPLLTQLTAITWPTVISIVYLAIFCSVYAFHIWYSGVEKLGAIRTSSFTYLNPLVAIIAGVMLLGEPLTPWVISGGSMIICGVFLANRRPASKQQQPIIEETKCQNGL